MNLSRRDFLKLSSFTLAGAALAACTPPSGGGDSGGETADAASTQITYLIRSDIGAKMAEWQEETVKQFAEVQPDIDVEVIGVPWGEYNAKLLALFAAGDPPEISANYAAGFPTFFANDAIVALDDFVEGAGADLSDIEQAALDSVTRNGKLWALPLAHLPTLMFYNKTMLDEAGVALPTIDWTDTSWTTDAVLEAATTMSHDVDNPAEAAWGLVYGRGQLGVHSWIWGADPFGATGNPADTEAYQTGKVTEAFYTSDNMLTAMNWIADLTFEHGVAPRPSDTDAIQQTVGWPMMSGRIGMYTNGAWVFTNFADVQPEWEWGVGAMPYGPSGSNVNPVFNDSWMLSSGSAEPEAGFTFLEYLALGDGARLYAEMTGFFPANKTLYDVFYDSVLQIPNIAMTKEDLHATFMGAFEHGYATPGKTLDSYPELNSAFNQTSGPIWNGEASVEDGMQAVQEKFEALIASYA